MANIMAVLGPFAKLLTGAAGAVDSIRKAVPQLEDEVTVEITGQPGHDKQQLYFLALAAANGEVRRFNVFTNFFAPCYGILMIEFDQASNWVRCTLRYKTSMLVANGTFQVIIPPGVGTIFDNLAVYRGPACEVVGGDFDFVDSTNIPTPGIPISSKSPDAPNGPIGLPFINQAILTPCPTTTPPIAKPIVQSPAPTVPKTNNGKPIPSPNPKPPGDNRSRGAVVVGSDTVPLSGSAQVTLGASSSGGSTPVKKCCPKTLALIPMVFAALSAPATDSGMRFTIPPTNPVDIG